MSGSRQSSSTRALVLALLGTLPWVAEPACAPKGACLRHSDCQRGQACVAGDCTFPSRAVPADARAIGREASIVDTGSPPPVHTRPLQPADAGSSLPADAGGSRIVDADARQPVDASSRREAGTVTPLTDH